MFSCAVASDCYEPSTTSLYDKDEGRRRRRRHGEITPTAAFESFEFAFPAVALEEQKHYQRQRNDPPTAKKTTSSKRVHFNETTLIHPTLHVADYSMEEMERTWYARKDHKAIKNKLRDYLQSFEDHPVAAIVPVASRMIMSSVIALDHRDDDDATREMDDDDDNKENSGHSIRACNTKESNDCFRGLEGKTIEGQMKKRMLKENARDVVFRAQSLQKWLLRDGGQEYIAQEYIKATKLARMAATRLAQKDEKEVQALWRSERAQYSSKSLRYCPHPPKGRPVLTSIFVSRHQVVPPSSPKNGIATGQPGFV